MGKFLTEPAKQLKVVLETDICVIGGSCTGLFAAVRASRLGVRVAVVEKQNCFGGVAAHAFVNVWHSLHDMDGRRQIIAGLTWETIQRLEKRRAVMYGDNRNCAYRMDTEELKIELDQMAVESKVSVFFHTMYTAPYLEEGELKGIIIENKDGRQVILARFFIDASGDGDLARDLGLACYRHELLQPPSPGFKLLGDISQIKINDVLQSNGSRFGLPEDWGWGGPIPGCRELSFQADTHVFNVDCSKAADLTNAEMEGRRQVRAVLDTLNRCSPEAVDLHIAAIGSIIGIRETVHYESDYQCTGDELLWGTVFEDAVAYGTYRVDIHHAAGAGITFRSLDGWESVHTDRNSPPVRRRWRNDNGYTLYYQIPFRTLVQRKVPNLVAVGRMINADPGAFGAIRVMVNLNQLGEAAGVAAYWAIQNGKPIWETDVVKLRTLLAAGGSVSL